MVLNGTYIICVFGPSIEQSHLLCNDNTHLYGNRWGYMLKKAISYDTIGQPFHFSYYKAVTVCGVLWDVIQPLVDNSNGWDISVQHRGIRPISDDTNTGKMS